MKIIKSKTLSIEIPQDKKVFNRPCARAIILDGENILLMYIDMFKDYSCPGGGIDLGESPTEGLIREVGEETGAKNIKIISDFVRYQEIREIKDKKKILEKFKAYDYIFTDSHFYICNADKKLGTPNLEDYEIKMGLKAEWINIHDAIKHNKKIREEKPNYMSVYLERELTILELVVKELF